MHNFFTARWAETQTHLKACLESFEPPALGFLRIDYRIEMQSFVEIVRLWIFIHCSSRKEMHKSCDNFAGMDDGSDIEINCLAWFNLDNIFHELLISLYKLLIVFF